MIVKQFAIVLAALFIGYGFSSGFHLPIPSNVLGFIILFLTLCLGVVKLKDVEDVSNFIIKYLSLFFIVPIVGVMVHFELISEQYIQIFVPMILSVLIGFFVAAKVTELFINIVEKKNSSINNSNGGSDYE